VPVLRLGRPTDFALDLATARARARRELARLPDALRGLGEAPPYTVTVAPALRALAASVDAAT